MHYIIILLSVIFLSSPSLAKMSPEERKETDDLVRLSAEIMMDPHNEAAFQKLSRKKYKSLLLQNQHEKIMQQLEKYRSESFKKDEEEFKKYDKHIRTKHRNLLSRWKAALRKNPNDRSEAITNFLVKHPIAIMDDDPYKDIYLGTDKPL